MTIALKPEHERFIESQIAKGQYHSADEVIDVAFRLLERLNSEYAEWINEVREKVAVAEEEVANGNVYDGETVVNNILGRFRQAKESQS
jgi:antitoxin ParD1/3/4